MNKKSIVPIVASATIIAASAYSPTHAVIADYIEKFANNNIIFYNPEECSVTASTELAGDNTKEKVWNYFHNKGLSDPQVAGIMGNIQQESDFIISEDSVSGGEHFRGLFQFGKYATGLAEKIESAGLGKYWGEEYYDNDSKIESESPGALDKLLQIQLDYAWEDWSQERMGVYGDWRENIKQSTEEPSYEPEYAAEVFVRDFEGASSSNTGDNYTNKYYHAGSHWQEVGQRRNYARQYYDEYSGKSMSASTSLSGDVCCDPNGVKVTYRKYPGKIYKLSSGQISSIAQYVAAPASTNDKSHVMSVLSYKLNVFEKEKGRDKDTAELISYLKEGTGLASLSDEEIEKNSFTNSTLTSAVEDVIAKGDRILPSQIVEEIEINGSTADNNGTTISNSDYAKFLRGITKISKDGKQIIFWDWVSPGKGSNIAYGYTESLAPSAATIAESIGTSAGSSNSGAAWEDGWIKSGIDGFVRDEVTSSTYSSLETSFGATYSTASAKGSGTGPNKITLFSTESSSAGDKASSLYNKSSGQSAPPHFTVDIKAAKVYQHGSIYKSAAATDVDAKAGIQIAIVGYSNSGKSSDSYYLGDDSNFSEDNYKYFYNLINAISMETGIPISSSVDWSSSTTMSGDSISAYKGILGRKHLQDGDATSVPKTVWNNLFTAMSNVVAANSAVCPNSAVGDVAALQNLVKTVAYADHNSLRGEGNRKKEWVDLINKGTWYYGGCSGNDCGGFVTTMMRESGWDEEYNPNKCGTEGCGTCSCHGQNWYLETSSKWKNVTSEIHSNDDAKPGDVLISTGHTLLYVGDIPGFNGKMASASWSSDCSTSRPPMADGASSIMTYIDSGSYRVFRKIR